VVSRATYRSIRFRCALRTGRKSCGLAPTKRAIGDIAPSAPSGAGAESIISILRPRALQNPNETTPMTTVLLTEPTRRDFLFVATAAAAAVGAGSTLIPLVAQMNPDASEIAAGAPVEVDLTPIAEGQVIKVIWRRKVIFISHRTGKSIDDARSVELSQLIDPQPDHARVKAGHEQWLVVSGTCTHAGCIPIVNRGDVGGWSCPCHGSQYDSSGRVRRKPASANLPVPPYVFVNDSKIIIG